MEKGFVKWLEMSEREYRASRLCRVLGNPKTYAILKVLAKEKFASPSRLARVLKRSRSTISDHLRSLRNLDLVSFQRKKGGATYWIKSVRLLRVLSELEDFVEFVGLKIQ